MAAVGNVNRGVHNAVVQLVSAHLADSGLPAFPRPYVDPRAKLSDALAADLEHAHDGDVRGLDDLWIGVTARQSFRPWEDLDRARVGADITGRKLAAFVQWRAARRVGDALVVMSLDDLARLLGGDPPTP